MEDLYLNYELSQIMDLIRLNNGTFSMNEKGDWVICLGRYRKYQYQGRLWDSMTFRSAYTFLAPKILNESGREEEET